MSRGAAYDSPPDYVRNHLNDVGLMDTFGGGGTGVDASCLNQFHVNM